MKYQLTAVALVVVLGGCGGGANTSSPGTLPATGRIVFVNPDGNDPANTADPEIFSIDDNGQNRRQLTDNAMTDAYPSLSRNGQKIAWLSTEAGARHINVMNADGSGKQQLTSNQDHGGPSISPDGNQIAFISSTPLSPLGNQFFIISSSGGAPRQVTSDATGKFFPAAWSPDGQTLVYSGRNSNAPHTDGIFRVSQAGGASQLVASRPDTIGSVAFTPSGKIVFTVDQTLNTSKLFQVNLDGSGLQDISDGQPAGIVATVSPDGSRVAYDRINAARTATDIVTRPLTGGTPRVLATSSGLPSWGPIVP